MDWLSISASQRNRTLCSNPFQESTSSKIDLPEEDADIVERMVEFFYKANYSDFQVDHFLKHARVFAIATKYGISHLCDLSRAKYWNTCVDRFDMADILDRGMELERWRGRTARLQDNGFGPRPFPRLASKASCIVRETPTSLRYLVTG